VLKIQFLDEGVDHSYRVVFADIAIKTFRQPRDLLSVFAFDESLHGTPRLKRVHQFYFLTGETGSLFTQPRPIPALRHSPLISPQSGSRSVTLRLKSKPFEAAFPAGHLQARQTIMTTPHL
jgi:hypothetical protein